MDVSSPLGISGAAFPQFHAAIRGGSCFREGSERTVMGARTPVSNTASVASFVARTSGDSTGRGAGGCACPPTAERATLFFSRDAPITNRPVGLQRHASRADRLARDGLTLFQARALLSGPSGTTPSWPDPSPSTTRPSSKRRVRSFSRGDPSHRRGGRPARGCFRGEHLQPLQDQGGAVSRRDATRARPRALVHGDRRRGRARHPDGEPSRHRRQADRVLP